VKGSFGATLFLAVLVPAAALAQVQPPASNPYERELQEVNRSIERQQRDIQQQQQREFETNQRLNAPRTVRMPGERPPGCPVGSAGC
jgi:septal ring factor EnvC (AmiA/AmiB activator)